MSECRMCGEEAEGKFCSTPCELKFEHIREDARDARLAEAEEARERRGPA